jgi:type II secretory pathway pseudopilin PulG
MKKSILLIGAVAVSGYIGLTAFGGQTKAQQEAEIASAIQTKLDNYRTELQAACDERVAGEAKAQYETWAAAEAEKPAPAPDKKGVAKKSTPKKTTPKKVDPLPNPTPPAPVDPSKQRGGATKEGSEDVKQRGGATKEGDMKDVKKRGGATKVEGGGGN